MKKLILMMGVVLFLTSIVNARNKDRVNLKTIENSNIVSQETSLTSNSCQVSCLFGSCSAECDGAGAGGAVCACTMGFSGCGCGGTGKLVLKPNEGKINDAIATLTRYKLREFKTLIDFLQTVKTQKSIDLAEYTLIVNNLSRLDKEYYLNYVETAK
jgi:hypothetical protein